MSAFVESWGLIALFAVILLESAGVPVPGETALIAAGVLASRGTFPIATVITVAAAAAVIGDNIGYLIGRFAGRGLIAAWPWMARRFDRVLPRSERFFERHGPKAVFFARFLPVLRVTGAWTAGVSLMTWWKFLLWNALGGVAWASLFGITTYIAGEVAGRAITKYGLIGGGMAAVVLVTGAVGMHQWRRRMSASAEPGASSEAPAKRRHGRA